MRSSEEIRRGRWSTYALLGFAALLIAAGRIAVVSSREGDTAFQSANDRSRWATISALVEDGTYAIDRQIAITSPDGRHPWDTIDKVYHRGRDGQLHHYSSKPTLYPTLVAGIYYVVYFIGGMTLTDQPIYVTRIVLACVNLPLLAIFIAATCHVIEQTVRSDFGRRLAVGVTCFGTMLLPFTLALNNHLPAAAAGAVLLWIFVTQAQRLNETMTASVDLRYWFPAGLAGGFLAANELPALSMAVFFIPLIFLLQKWAVVPYLSGMLVVAFGFFFTNYLAHQSLRTAYAHRGDGAVVAEISFTDPGSADAAVREALREQRLLKLDGSLQMERQSAGRWLVQTSGNRRFVLQRLDEPNQYHLRYWDDWYDYPGSYWREGTRRGVDRGEPNTLRYLFHMTLGHYGLFLITPFWLLLPLGFTRGLRSGSSDLRRLVGAILLASLVCLTFYALRPTIDRNYGGVSCCLRWMLWFAPFWLFVCAAGLDWINDSRRREWWWCLVILLAAGSVFSAATCLDTPWQAPWPYRYGQFLGWIES